MSPRRRLFGYYRQFEALDPAEDAARMRAKRAGERATELERVTELDLSGLEWHQGPDPEVVNAATFALRRAINRYPDTAGLAVEAVARRHRVDAARIALGHGAGELLQTLLRELPAGEVVLPWPGWAPLPALVARAGARPVPVPLAPGGAPDLDALAAAIGPETRAVVVATPNDPTGVLCPPAGLEALAQAHPGVTVVADEALIEFAGEEHSLVPATARQPNLFVLRSFSKAFSLAGLRAGYLLGPPQATELIGLLPPGQGVAAPTQGAVAAALEQRPRYETRLQARRAVAAAERAHLAAGLAGTDLRVSDSAAHVVWVGGEAHDAAALTHALGNAGIRVASGANWGDEHHVRIALADRRATDRVLAALTS